MPGAPNLSSDETGDREERSMIIDYVLGGGVALFLLAYLLAALLRPERF